MIVKEFNEIPDSLFLSHPVIAIVHLKGVTFYIKASQYDLGSRGIHGCLYCCTNNQPSKYLHPDGTLNTSMQNIETMKYDGWYTYLHDIIDALKKWKKKQ